MRVMQLDMFAPPPPPPVMYVERPRKEIVTKAYGGNHVMEVYADEPDPFEVEVRGIPTLITPGFCTYVIQPVGSLFWSGTGFRSFGNPLDDPDEIVVAIERYIDRPAKDGNGCGGKLERWWPMYITQWQQNLAFELNCCKDRSTVWAQWGPEKHAEHWASYDAKQAAAMSQMLADGIDPNDVGNPSHFKGKWPRFSIEVRG